MRILIVGGTGFVGKSFADWALRDSHIEELVLASRNPEISLGSVFLKTYSGQSKLKRVITGTTDFWDIATSCDAVIYAASSSDARDYQSANKIFSADLDSLRAYLLRHSAKTPLVYLSSGAVYGKQPTHVSAIKEEQAAWKDEPGKALYASIKRQAEAEIIRYSEQTGCQTSIARLFAFCGAWLPTDQHFLIGNMISALEGRNAIEVRAPYAVFRSYMAADHLSYALLHLCKLHSQNAPIIVNIGSEHAYEMHDFAAKLASQYELPYLGSSSDALIKDKVDRYIPSTEYMNNLFGLYPEPELDQILQNVIERRSQLGMRCK